MPPPPAAFVVTLSSVDLGQGLKTVMTQICAETIGVPFDNVIIDTADTDTGPHCMGTFASRGTHRIGNAIMMAAQEAREVMLEVAAEELEVDAADLETDGKGIIHVKGAPSKGRSRSSRRRSPPISSTASTISGRGMFLQPKRSYPGAGDRQDVAGRRLGPCLHGRRGRGRHRDRRGDGAVAEERLRDRPRASIRRWSSSRSSAAPGWA